MKNEVKIIIAEDDQGHAALIKKNLKRSGLANEFIHFTDGEATLEYLFKKGRESERATGVPLLLLLDIKMPKVDGIEVLRQVKNDPELRKIPVTMITTTDDPREVENCYKLGCSSYITKPIDYDKFVEAIRKLGLYLMVVEIPDINGKDSH